MNRNLTRREMFRCSGAAAGVGLVSGLTSVNSAVAKPQKSGSDAKIRFCLNTSTIRGKKIPLKEVIDLTAKAGYDGIEPWIGEIDKHVKSGGTLKDLKKQLADAGLKVESAIGFANWIVEDEKKRKAGLERAKRDMDMVRQIGGTRIAAPPAGATRQKNFDLLQAAQRYKALLELGREMGVVPQVEVWGFSSTLKRLGEAVLVAVESGHPDACILPDVYHIYKGGSDFAGLKLLSGYAIHVMHMNDYPADPPREKIGDADRVYPGDGVAPLKSIIKDMHDAGFHGAYSLELFNRDYWKQDPSKVLKTGLEKMKAAVEKSLG